MENDPQLSKIQLDENGQIVPTLYGNVSKNIYGDIINSAMSLPKKYQNFVDTNKSNIENIPRDNQINNLGLGLAEIGQPYLDITAHPIQSIQGLGYSATHLPEVANNIYDELINGSINYYTNPQAMYENPAYPLKQVNDIAGLALLGKGFIKGTKYPIQVQADNLAKENAKLLNTMGKYTSVNPHEVAALEKELSPQALKYYKELRGGQ